MASMTQDSRDLRSAQQESKRFRDSSAKWSHGSRPSYGCKISWPTGEVIGGSKSQVETVRPCTKNSDNSHHKKRDQNVIKGRDSWETPQRRVKAMISARNEIKESNSSDAFIGSQPQLDQSLPQLADSFTQASDSAESHSPPQSLDTYFKAPTERDTARLVQREYEVLDVRGRSLRGKEAKLELGSPSASHMPATEDDFELV